MTGPRQGRVVIVEDNHESAEFLAELVRAEGYEPILCGTAAEAAATFRAIRPVAVFLDWVLPDRSGIDLCRELRGLDAIVPILFVSGRDDEATVSRGLDAGADDFVLKPVRTVELVARLDAHLRKAHAVATLVPAEAAAGERFGEIEVDLRARVARVAGLDISLGPLEFRVLEYLARHAGMAVSRDQLIAEVYGYDVDLSTERVDLVVRRLRHKLGHGPSRAGLLVAVPGYGYRLDRK